MITFACKNIQKEDLVRCSFDLNKPSYNLLLYLVKQKSPLKSNEIAEGLGLDRSSVQKAMRKLMEKNLVVRSQKNFDTGGYVYVYNSKDKKEIKERLDSIISDWYNNALKEIGRI